MSILQFAFHLILELRLVAPELLQLLSVHLYDLVLVFPLHVGITDFLLKFNHSLLEFRWILALKYGNFTPQIFTLFLRRREYLHTISADKRASSHFFRDKRDSAHFFGGQKSN